jgi:monoamine oxidase
VRAALSRAVFSDGAVNTAWVGNPYVSQGPAVESGFVCGVQRHVLETEDKAFAALDQLVETAVGAPVTRIAGLCKNWTPDPFALGMGAAPTFSLLRPLVAQLVTPERRVHFAGDYTDVAMCATMEGAVRSGERAADEVLRQPVRLHPEAMETQLVRS